ncbi:MAG TPA: hypothetical protein DCE42_09050 [Myxococcales bacterium]|nr:hypothetical protein [Deltaproteobacteria bacterium]MBU51008.1 hypothetical protein [Deltaproteobacteria bacterium]HAA54893.1 hypothetical protein [Myxococcales bacterium]|tara:strand:+ start:3352 stop:4242 length:891 start_codon:yes stop_codon:yes gene_type:complete
MLYFVRQTWRNIKESWGLVFQTLLMMSVCLLILGVFGLTALQIEEVLRHWEGEAPLLVYTEPQLSKQSSGELQARLMLLSEVSAVRFVSQKEAMGRLRESLGKQKELLKGLDAPLFPPSFELQLRAEARGTKQVVALSRKIRRWEGVQEVDAGKDWVAPLWKLARWMRAVFWGGGALLLLCTSLMAAGTIRLTFYMHQDEIEIMRLVGATERFIRAPFYLEGVFEGFFAASLSLCLLFGMFLFLQAQYGAAFVSFTTRSLRFFSFFQLLSFLAVGMLAGLFGSWLALFTGQLSKRR